MYQLVDTYGLGVEGFALQASSIRSSRVEEEVIPEPQLSYFKIAMVGLALRLCDVWQFAFVGPWLRAQRPLS